MRGVEFAEFSAFAAVAKRGNFSKAAVSLGVSTSRLSEAIRSLEERLGVRVFNRTTRSVALTEAGQKLLIHVQPALDELGHAAESVNNFRDTPTGVLRLSVVSLSVGLIVEPILPAFSAAYPEITVDIVVDDSCDDIVGGSFDAGIRSASFICRDMIALRVSPDSRLIAVAAPSYLANHPCPKVPDELLGHHCIRFRQSTGAIDPWAFEKGDAKVEIAVDGSLITNNLDLALRAVREGLGIGYMLEDQVAADIAENRLVPLIEDWARPCPGFHLFYPSRRHVPMKLRVFADFLRGGRALPHGRAIAPGRRVLLPAA